MKKNLYFIAVIIGFTIANSALAQMESDEDFVPVTAPSKSVKLPVRMVPSASSSLRVLIPTGTAGTEQKTMTLKEWKPTANYPFYIPGLAKQPDNALLNKLIGENATRGQERVVAMKELASWYANYVGKDLPKNMRERLSSLYNNFISQQPMADNRQLSKAQSDVELDRNAKSLVSFLLSERQIIGNNSSAQIARYKRVLLAKYSRQPTASEMKALVADARKFLSLDYVHNIKANPGSAPSLAAKKVMMRIPGTSPGSFSMVPMKRQMTYDETISQASTDIMHQLCDPKKRWTKREMVGEPYADEYKHDVLLAEHPVTGDTWGDFGLPTLYHTSIIVEAAYLEHAIFETTVYKCEGTMLHKVVESKSLEKIDTWRHLDWPMAHSAMGSYGASDTLTLIVRFHGLGPDAVELVNRQTFGTTPDANGKYCRGRYGAYPDGLYGVNFVCHQNINAFARVKWNVTPVWYWESIGLYGFEGHPGIGDITHPCECPVTDKSHVGCIPGCGCCCVDVPGTGLQSCASWEYNRGTGCGYGLINAWNPKPGKGWMNSEFKFNECSVNISGADEYVGSYPVP